MNNVLAHLRDNIGPARDGDPEGIHQLHIATRRTRSALRMFKTQLLPMVVQQFDKELRDSALIFGKARDWQLFVTETLDAVPNAEAIGKCAVQQQTLAFHNAKRLLADPRFEGILDRMTDWIDEVSIPSTIEALTPDLLDRLAKRVIRRRRRAVISDENSLHRLRKSAKDLRYWCRIRQQSLSQQRGQGLSQ